MITSVSALKSAAKRLSRDIDIPLSRAQAELASALGFRHFDEALRRIVLEPIERTEAHTISAVSSSTGAAAEIVAKALFGRVPEGSRGQATSIELDFSKIRPPKRKKDEEEAFRRGFQQGAYRVFQAISEGASLELMERYVNDDLRIWRGSKEDAFPPYVYEDPPATS